MILHLCKGLPGSGKTMLLRNLTKQVGNSRYLALDHAKDNNQYINEFKLMFKRIFFEHAMLDALFLDEEALKETILIAKKYQTIKKVFIYEFKLNREQCLINDKYRFNKNERTKTAEATIKNYPYEMINVPSFKQWGKEQKISIQIERKKVYNMDEIIQLVRKADLTINSDGYITSESWSLGGTTGSYTGQLYNISPDPQPITFELFDRFINEVAPNITFMQYKLLQPLIKTKTFSERDYYGGYAEYAYFYFDPQEVVKELREMKLF